VEECVLVTGASSGIGKEIYDWYKTYYSSCFHIHGLSRRGPEIRVDLSSPDARERLLDRLTIPVKILVNNAGILLLDESDLKESSKMVEVNLMAIWHLISGIFKRDLFARNALVINIASISGIQEEAYLPLYAATKAGVVSLTKSFALRFASEGIRVNCISPGIFKTNLVPGDTPEDLIEKVPLKREARVWEIIPIVRMLMDCTYMTGSNIVVDGGLLLNG
jgi:3-oxoacyl-[acyl-carrier protein] reductase